MTRLMKTIPRLFILSSVAISVAVLVCRTGEASGRLFGVDSLVSEIVELDPVTGVEAQPHTDA